MQRQAKKYRCAPKKQIFYPQKYILKEQRKGGGEWEKWVKRVCDSDSDECRTLEHIVQDNEVTLLKFTCQ